MAREISKKGEWSDEKASTMDIRVEEGAKK